MTKSAAFKDIFGNDVLTYEYASRLRAEDKEERKKNFIMAQSGGQERILSSQADISITGGSRGGPLMTDTKVVTPFGLRRIKDIKVGDTITGLDGCMQRVINKVNYGKLKSYKLKLIDGSEVIASYDHPWNVRKTCCRSKKRILNGGGVKSDWRVWTTQMIVDYLDKKRSKNQHTNIVIPLCEPVKFTRSFNRYGVDPYLLGVLLGDGCLSEHIIKHNNVMFTTEDKEIVDAFINAGYDAHKRTAYKDVDYIFKSPELVENLKKLKLAGHLAYDKFIPTCFKFGTVEERFAILQGLMDTDGTIDKRGHCSFTSVSKRLAEDVKFLVNSLGGLATVSESDSFYTKDGERFAGSTAYHVYIRIKDSFRIFRLERKKRLSTKYNGGISEYTRKIVDYEYVGEQECCCIGVSNPDSLFLVEDFIVTHNSKSFSILMEGLKDIKNPNFSAIILRNEKPDLENIIEDSKRVYKDYGTYISSDKSMYWDLKTGGRIRFSFHAGDYDDFVTRFQGKQYSYIAIDEITHISWKKFLYLSTCLRNAHGIRNRIVGSCNPDPESWVAEFIAWWIGFPDTVYSDGQIHPERDGLPIPERDGKIRYCFLAGAETISDIVWGDTREEVYEKCREQIAEMWTPDMEEYGDPKDLFILSVSFVESKLTDNKKLLESDPSYLARLANQSEEQRQRDLAGNWHYKSKGDDYLTMEIMENFFKLEPQWGDRKPRAAMDVALQGGDNCWMWLIVGNHIADVDVCQVDAEQLVSHTRNRLRQWGVREEDFTYDANGIGGLMRGFFKKAVPFNNMEAPYGATEKDRKVAKQDYDTLKSQCLFDLADAIKYGRISISRDLLGKRFSGKGFENRTLREILMEERRCIKVDQEKANRGKGKCLIQKGEMKKIIHRSPDALESLGYSRIFWVKNTKPHCLRPIGAARFSDASGTEGGQRRGNPVRMASAFPRTRYI